ncbi:MAG: DUF2007 domain-containing protein [Candidatus Krumholzibacteria bacterium]|nr:DUF2007 domain-containing protein [Candidatus Krumholzibacteria bacterium]
MSQFIPVRVYKNRFEAEQAEQYLAGQGIEAWVQADDAGGMYAGLSLSRRGVRLWVRPEDADRAKEALEPGVMIDPPIVDGEE